MKRFFILKLLPDGDIEIAERKPVENGNFYYEERVYHKSFDPGEKIKDNLIDAYEEWERLEDGR